MMMGEMSQDPPFKCEGTTIPLVEEVELLSVTIDNKLKFESQIKKICCMPQSKPANHCFVFVISKAYTIKQEGNITVVSNCL